MSWPNWCRSLLMPLGSIVWRRHIQRSSWNSRSASVFNPVCKIQIFMSFSGLWSGFWKCCARAQLPGLLRQSYLCLDIRVCSGSPVCPTQSISHFLQLTAQIKSFDLQLPKSLIFDDDVGFLLFFITVDEVSDAQILQPFPHSSVDRLFASIFRGIMSLRINWFLKDLGRRKATVGSVGEDLF